MIYKNDDPDRNTTDLSIFQELLHNTTKSIIDKTYANSISQIINSRKISTNIQNQPSSKITYENTNNPTTTLDEFNQKSNRSNLQNNSNIRFQNYSIIKDSNSSYTSYINQVKYDSENKKKRKSSINPFQGSNPLNLIESIKEIEDTTPYGKIKIKIKILDLIIGLLSAVSIVLSITDNEIFISKSNDFISNYMKNNNILTKTMEVYKKIEERNLDLSENLIRILNGAASICGCVFLFIRYHCELVLYKMDKKLSEYDGIVSSGFLPYLLIECMISLIFYPPFINKVIEARHETVIYVYSGNSILSIVSLLKVYFISKILLYLSRYNTKISHAICKSHKITPGFQFIIKCEMKLRLFTTMTTLVLLFLVVFGFMTRSFEYSAIDIEKGLEGKKGINDLANLVNCIWLIIITITTVGYGDEYPRTDLGRVVVFFGCTFGMLGLGLTIASLSSGVEFSPVEKKAYLKLKKLFDPDNVEHKSVNVIKTILLLRKNLKLKNECSSQFMLLKNLKVRCFLVFKLKAETFLFKNDYHIARNYSMPINDLIKTMETKLYDNLMSLTKHLDKINLVENDFQILEKNQHEIQKKFKKIIKTQEDITKYLVDFHNRNYLNEKVIKEEKEKKISKSSPIKKKPIVPIIQINSPSKILKDQKQGENNTAIIPSPSKTKGNFLGIVDHRQLNKNSPRNRNKKRKITILSEVEEGESIKSECISKRGIKKHLFKQSNFPLNGSPKKKVHSPERFKSIILSPAIIKNKKNTSKDDAFKIELIPSIQLNFEEPIKHDSSHTIIENKTSIPKIL